MIPKLVINPNKDIVKGVLFLYSLETFLAYKLNAAARNQDNSKIRSLGPFSLTL